MPTVRFTRKDGTKVVIRPKEQKNKRPPPKTLKEMKDRVKDLPPALQKNAIQTWKRAHAKKK